MPDIDDVRAALDQLAAEGRAGTYKNVLALTGGSERDVGKHLRKLREEQATPPASAIAPTPVPTSSLPPLILEDLITAARTAVLDGREPRPEVVLWYVSREPGRYGLTEADLWRVVQPSTSPEAQQLIQVHLRRLTGQVIIGAFGRQLDMIWERVVVDAMAPLRYGERESRQRELWVRHGAERSRQSRVGA
jgi:alkylated DNA nucleotide flippase Atl1